MVEPLADRVIQRIGQATELYHRLAHTAVNAFVKYVTNTVIIITFQRGDCMKRLSFRVAYLFN
ncbi:MAG: hypothetical protein CO013_10525 [Syntrophobacterales bacterium CG_4_8_14_3_um_filter_58_8]|nr:MAG: hypothetical protein AUK26_03340 [Syntrophaceae bacterium CG2_30_58_14]PIV05722.1 MAG: hypothetical protein COS57_06840 [Syntrophobacterales bacterium CG03_land_8_20_14_0_80_58_14]PJC72204.1 MAG: hypothetical protein CO013_10525 [Syntrophobacterales bacterium CG_4_8_14_3_um_filter_58_8]